MGKRANDIIIGVIYFNSLKRSTAVKAAVKNEQKRFARFVSHLSALSSQRR